jgi:hypothetical protein
VSLPTPNLFNRFGLFFNGGETNEGTKGVFSDWPY